MLQEVASRLHFSWALPVQFPCTDPQEIVHLTSRAGDNTLIQLMSSRAKDLGLIHYTEGGGET